MPEVGDDLKKFHLKNQLIIRDEDINNISTISHRHERFSPLKKAENQSMT